MALAGTGLFGLRALKGLKELSHPQLSSAANPLAGTATVKLPSPQEEEEPQRTLLSRFMPGDAPPQLKVALDLGNAYDKGVEWVEQNVTTPFEQAIPLAGGKATAPWGKTWAWPAFAAGIPLASLAGWGLADKLVDRRKKQMRKDELAAAENAYMEALQGQRAAMKQAAAGEPEELSTADKLTKLAARQGVINDAFSAVRDALPGTLGDAAAAVTDGGKKLIGGAVDLVDYGVESLGDSSTARDFVNTYQGPFLGVAATTGMLGGLLAHRGMYNKVRDNSQYAALRKAIEQHEREEEQRTQSPVHVTT